jgi:hypothetical protein
VKWLPNLQDPQNLVLQLLTIEDTLYSLYLVYREDDDGNKAAPR